MRLTTGELRWYVDGDRLAYPRDGEIVVERGPGLVHPRGNRFMGALAVRSSKESQTIPSPSRRRATVDFPGPEGRT